MKQNSIFKNTIWIVGCRLLQSLFSLIIGMLTARYLGSSDYGLINYAASVVAFIAPIMKLGLNHILVNESMNDSEKDGEIFGTAIVCSLFSSILCIIGVTAFVYVANPNEPTTLLVCVLYSISLCAQALEMIQYWFQAKMISQYTSLISLGAYLVVSAYKIYLLVTKKSVGWFALSQTLDYIIVAFALILFFGRLSHKKLSVSFRRFRKMFSQSKYFIISSLMITVFAQTDKIMLKAILSEEAVGIYSAAITCASMTGFVFVAIIDSVRPMVISNKKISKDAYENSLIMCFGIVIYLSLAQSALFTMFSNLIVNILYGAQYVESASVLSVVVWYTTFSYIGSVRSVWLITENKQKYLWIINLSGAIANVVLNAALIPFMGVMGAAWASLITQIFTNVIVGFIIKPIRYSNCLMLKGCDPRLMINYAKKLIAKIR